MVTENEFCCFQLAFVSTKMKKRVKNNSKWWNTQSTYKPHVYAKAHKHEIKVGRSNNSSNAEQNCLISIICLSHKSCPVVTARILFWRIYDNKKSFFSSEKKKLKESRTAVMEEKRTMLPVYIKSAGLTMTMALLW